MDIFVFLLAFGIGVASFLRWIRRSPRFVAPLWRSKIALLGFVCCSVSCLLYLAVHIIELAHSGTFRTTDPLTLNIAG